MYSFNLQITINFLPKIYFIFFSFIAQIGFVIAQHPLCNGNLIYQTSAVPPLTNLKVTNPNLPFSPTNPSITNVPAQIGFINFNNLTIAPNLNGGTLSPTFYSDNNLYFHYWDGFNWVNTGHTSNGYGNLASCGNLIYSMLPLGTQAIIQTYNGTGNATPLVTISNGPYIGDMEADCNCNFYLLSATALSLYSPNGTALCSWSVNATPAIVTFSYGSLAISGNTVYVGTGFNGNSGYIGIISGAVVNFTQVPGFGINAGDMATCSGACVASSITASAFNTGTVNCFTPTVNVVSSVTTALNPLSYVWSGPGIVGSANGSVATVNVGGTYTCVISTIGCPPALIPTQTIVTTVVNSNTVPTTASIIPFGMICPLPSASLIAVPSGIAYTSVWSGPGILNGANTPTITLNSGGIYTVSITNTVNGCVGTATQTVQQAPSLALGLSSSTLCAQNINGSINTITLSATGAINYTLLSDSYFSTSSPNSSLIPVNPIPPFSSNPTVATATLIGFDGTCSNTITSTFTILPNPVLAVIPLIPSICIGTSKTLSVSGANTYTWSPVIGLNTSNGNSVIANPTLTTVYSIIGSSLGCSSATENVTLTILPLPTLSINPINSAVCLNTTTVSLSALGTGTSFTWSPAQGLSGTSGQSVFASPLASTNYTVLASLNGCTNSAVIAVTVVPPPSLALSLSSNSFCAQALNGSPNSITLTSSGATTFTLLTPNHFNNTNPSGPASPVSLTPPYLNAGPATATLLGSNGVCTLSLTANFTVVPNPTVALNSFTPVICAGQTFTYTTNGATSFTWSSATPGSTLYTTGNVAVANPSINSVFSVFGSSLSCNSALQTTSITVTPLPVFTIQPNPALTCLGTAINLAAIGNASTYSWIPATGLNQTQGANVSSNPPSQQNYTVIGTSNNCSTTAMATVSVLPLPNLQLSPTQSAVCIGNPLHLNVFGASQFTWSPNTGLNTVNSPNVIASPNVNTTYLVVGSNGICTNTLSIPITVIAYPSLTVSSPYQEICIGSSVPIYASGAQNYAWLPATGLSNNNGISALASPNVNTTYTIIGINSSGSVQCTQQIAYQILVIPLANAQISNSTAICLGEATQLTASGGNVYEWLPQEGLNNTHQPNVIANPSVSTTYTVDVSQNGFCNAKKSVFVQVNPNPIINAGRDSSFNLNEPMFIMASGTGSITWISGEGIACSSCAYTQIYPRIDNCYIALVSNEFNCTAKDEVCIKVTAEYAIYIPNSFTPNKDGLNDVFFVYGDNLIDLQLQIFDRWGQLIFYTENPNSGWDGSYQGKDCAMGTYTYKVAYKSPDRKQYFKAGSLSLMR